MQAASPARTAIRMTVLNALEPSVRSSQFLVSCNLRACNPTCSTHPGNVTPQAPHASLPTDAVAIVA